MRSFALPLAIVIAIAAPALAAGAAEPPAAPGAQVNVDGQRPLSGAGNPNQVICRSQNVPGSRLRSQRVCATRQQWNEQRRTDRELIEKAQTTRVWPS